MSFHLEKLVLKDWLAYEGEVPIEFGHPQDGRNLWVIYGMNGAGKTSLLRAIQWVFHDVMPDRHIKDCFNHAALRAGRNELSVRAEFLYNGQHYRLIRRAEVDTFDGEIQSYPRTNVELAVNNELQKASIEDSIEQILPKDCQRFFFFDGLEIKEYASPHSDQTKDAIERVLGIPEIRNLESDLEKLVSELTSERDKLLAQRREYDSMLDEKAEAEIHRDSAKETLQNLKDKQANLDTLIAGLEQRAERLERVKDEIELLKSHRRQKGNLQDRLRNYDRELRQLLTTVSKRMVLPLLREQVVHLETQVGQVERVTLKAADIQARQALIQELLGGADCICGRDLTSQATAQLHKHLQELEQEGNRIKRIQTRTGTLREQAVHSGRLESLISKIEAEPDKEKIEQALMTKYKLSVQLEELEQEITKLESQLKGHEDTEVGEVYSTLGERRNERTNLDAQIERAEEEVARAERELQKKENELSALAEKLPQQHRLVTTLERTKAAHAVAEELVRNIAEMRHEAVQSNLTNVFRSVTNKPKEYDRIDLGADYTPKVVTKAGNLILNHELSAGEKEIVAFSFIAGLNLSTETSAPLVMDTPFGHLDIEHRDGLLEALPKLPSQVILLATNRDVPTQDLPKLNYCLGGIMHIVRDQDSERSFVEGGD